MSGLDRETKAIRRTIAEARKILESHPPVDTFLGRKTQELFPKGDEEHMAKWLASKELKPPT